MSLCDSVIRFVTVSWYTVGGGNRISGKITHPRLCNRGFAGLQVLHSPAVCTIAIRRVCRRECLEGGGEVL